MTQAPDNPSGGAGDPRLADLSPEKLALLMRRLKAKGGEGEGGDADPAPRLEPRPAGARVPLSFAQERLWFVEQLDPGRPTFNMPSAVRLSGPLSVPALEGALAEVVARHEMLRTTFAEDDEGAHQVVTPAADAGLGLRFADLSSLPAEARHAELLRLTRAEASRPFDLRRGPLLRAVVLRLGAADHALLLTLHHIATDRESMAVLLDEVGRLYVSLASGRPPGLPALELQYGDFAHWQRRWLDDERLERLLDHWRRRLEGAPAHLDLPTDRPRTAVPGHAGDTRSHRLGSGVTEALHALGREVGATPFMTTLALYLLLLARWSGQRDVSVGVPVSGRTRLELEPLVGFFVNTLVIRVDLAAEPDFRTLLGRVRDAVLDAHRHQDLPYERLDPGARRSLSTTPHFQAFFTYEPGGAGGAGGTDLGGLRMRPLAAGSRRAKFDVSLAVEAGDGDFDLSLLYRTRLFDAATAEGMLAAYARLAAAAAEEPGAPPLSLPLLGAEERRQLVRDTRGAAVEAVPPVHLQVARAAAEAPHRVAVVDGRHHLSYGELVDRARRLARRLRRAGVGPDRPVAVALPRSAELMVALLGVLESGGAYLPLDPGQPLARLAALVADAGCRHLVTAGAAGERLAGMEGAGDLAVVPSPGAADAAARGGPPGPAPDQPEALAYVIYTSGSTGRPKGVMVAHRSLAAYTAAAAEAYGIGPGDRALQFASVIFDASGEEIWPTLARGATLELRDEQMLGSLPTFTGGLARRGVTVLNLPTAYWHTLAAGLEAGEAVLPPAVRLVVIGGEEAGPDRLAAWPRTAPAARLVNTYGPTEGTIVATATTVTGKLPESGESPIGRPVAGVHSHLLDDDLEPVPRGVRGEIHLGGTGVARGYLGRPALTAERFVPDPFAEAPGRRLYRTGDLARLAPDGGLTFAGRRDTQVKLRGFRIEPGEVEAALRRHPRVSDATVVVRGEASAGRLVAYVVARGAISGEELHTFLVDRLPDFMVPAAFVTLHRLPLTTTGKLDHDALPEPRREADGVAAARTPMEEIVAGLFAEVLGEETVGLKDDFFTLGGHSLVATRLLTRLRRTLGVDVPLHALFEHSTVERFAACVDALGAGPSDVPAPPPLVAAPRPANVPVSFSQERLWFLDRLQPGSGAYNLRTGLRFRGPLSPGAMGGAFSRVVERHESLRTHLAEADGRPVQVIAPAAPSALPNIDLSGLPREPAEAALRRISGVYGNRPFDLSVGPLYRAAVVRLAEDDHAVLCTLHHVIADGWSVSRLVSEINVLYAAALTGEPAELPPLPVQYADFAIWQRDWLRGEVLASEIDHWRQRLAGAPEVLDLPTDRPRPPVRSFRGGRVPFRLDQATTTGLKELARERGATLFMACLAGFAALLGRLSGTDDVTVGTPVAGRDRVMTEPIIGFFANTLVLRLGLGDGVGFGRLVERARATVLDAHAHRHLPFETLVRELRPRRNLSHSPLFQVLLTLENEDQEQIDLPDLRLSPLTVQSRSSRFDLSLDLLEAPAGLRGSLEYSADLFDRATAEGLAARLARMLEAAVAEPRRPLAEIDLLTDAERRQLIAGGAGADLPPVPGDAATLHGAVLAAAAAHPGAPALVAGDHRLTYGELVQRAGRLASRLGELGVGAEDRVGVCLERGPDLVPTLLAVLMAGGAYVPLDPAYPPQRLAFMLADSGARVVVTRGALADRLPADGIHLHLLDGADGADGGAEGDAAAWRAPTVPPAALAYLIYTSGSTGLPKGVAIPHAAATALLAWAVDTFDAGDLDHVLAATSVCFDLSVFEIFVPLAAGATVVLVEDALALAAAAEAAPVTLVNTVPSAMAELVRAGDLPASLRVVNLAGEPLRRELVDAVHRLRPDVRVYNLYGPSEDTTYSTGCRVPAGEAGEPTIGRPVAGTVARVLDPGLRALPPGVAGELFLAGAGLARGYLGRPALTAERFVPDPYSEDPGRRLYRTGDLARWRRDGELDFLGRADHQVKVRGFRIEPGEVETTLERHPAVAEAAVEARPGADGDLRLVAWWAAGEEGDETSAAALRAWLGERLPGHMVPARLLRLPALPRTPNGKLDRRALAARELPAAEAETSGGELPAGPVAGVVAAVWEEVLAVASLGSDSHFFHLGGHSLLAVRVVSRLRAALGVEVPVRTLFDAPTLGAFHARVEAALGDPGGDGDALPALVSFPRDQPLPLSFAQERMWFLDRLEPDSSAYHVALPVRLRGPLSAPALATALDGVVRRHEVLRSRYVESSAGPRQVAEPPAPLPLPVLDLGSLSPARRDPVLRRLARRQAEAPFDLAGGPVIRASLVRAAAEDHALLLTVHHIAFDGWSAGILLRETARLYAAVLAGRPSPLPALELGYADYAAWQRSWLSGDRLRAEVDWWRGELSDLPPVLELPTDRPRPAVRSAAGASLGSTLGDELSSGVRAYARRHGATPFMVLMAAWQVLLRRYSGQARFAVGTPVAGRDRVEVEELIGFFVNTLVVRAEIPGEISFDALVAAVRERSLAAHGHQQVPFERLVEELAPERSLSHSPIFQVVMVLQNTARRDAPEALADGLRLEPLGSPATATKFDLSLVVADPGGGAGDGAFGATFEYSTELFDAATVERLAGHLRVLLGHLLDHPGADVTAAPLLTPDEERQVLVEWGGAPPPSPPGAGLAHHVFAAAADRRPDAAAVVCGRHTLTYGGLARRARRLAHRLRRLGVGPDVPVAVCAERSPELVLAILAVLEAGGAYLPLDPAYPPARLRYLLADAAPPVLLTAGVDAAPFADFAGTRVALADGEVSGEALPDEAPAGEGPDAGTPAPEVDPRHLAYVIYTSGSTGRPKGVMVTHRGTPHLARAQREAFETGPGERVLQFASTSFDASFFELMVAWGAGAPVYLAPRDQLLPGPPLDRFLRRAGITHATLGPSAVAALPDPGLPALATLVVAGEACPPELARSWRRGRRFVNAYGPTEATVWSTAWLAEPLREGAQPPIGRPVAGTRCRVLDRRLRPLPAGLPGELHLAGPALARGYRGRPALTAERFVPDPHGDEPGGRLYRTGDLARWTAGGDLEFLGRADHQVKVRGFRIEPGEVEAVLGGHPAVRECAVVPHRAGAGDLRLVAWWVAVEDAAAPAAAKLRAWLGDRLPEHMLPGHLGRLEALPLTPHGKVDRRELATRRPDARDEAATPGRPPAGDAEEVVAAVWREMLEVERVGAEEDFFVLGGHSLLATRVLTRVQEIFQIELPLRSVFERPTVAGLVTALEAAWGDAEVVAEIARTWRQVEALSEDEVAELMAGSEG